LEIIMENNDLLEFYMEKYIDAYNKSNMKDMTMYALLVARFFVELVGYVCIDGKLIMSDEGNE